MEGSVWIAGIEEKDGEREDFRLWLPNPPSPLALGLCEADRAFSGIGNEVSERPKRQFLDGDQRGLSELSPMYVQVGNAFGLKSATVPSF